jgi:hypothetical protein
LLDQLRERIRYCHCSLRTEQSYVHWVRHFSRFGMRHAREVGEPEIEAYLTMLANQRRIAASTA